ncbi:hypothetical protein LIA77_11720 [Sarocladium implicatum]|nr:hypothetical protein LIA77_11720 [Sarocladium implicatum]
MYAKKPTRIRWLHIPRPFPDPSRKSPWAHRRSQQGLSAMLFPPLARTSVLLDNRDLDSQFSSKSNG